MLIHIPKTCNNYLSLPEPEPLESLFSPFSLIESLPDSFIEPFYNKEKY